MSLENPLRYPGGKSYLRGYIAQVLKANGLEGCTLHEPYAGSAAVSLAMLSQGLVQNVVLVERDPLIYAFWKSVVSFPDRLCEAIREIDVSLQTWYELLPLREATTPLEYPILRLGLAGLFYNRTNYSGILMANPLGGKKQLSLYGIGCRFNKTKIVQRIMAIAEFRDKIAVEWGDALVHMRRYRRELHETKSFVYIDPPYYGEKTKGLYRFHYEDRDHSALAKFIKGCRFPWLISYDDCSVVRNLYFDGKKDIHLQRLYLDYSAQNHKKGSELLISNLELPPAKRLNSVHIEAVTNSRG